MKIVFDTNVYIAEALGGNAATAIIAATERARWRIFISDYLLDELQAVLIEDFGFTQRLADLSLAKSTLRSQIVDVPPSRHRVPDDEDDTQILGTVIAAGADYLITNDLHLLRLDPYEGIRIISMTAYYELLVHDGLLP